MSCFIVKGNGNGKCCFEKPPTSSTPFISKLLCVYVCTIIIDIICAWHAAGGGGGGAGERVEG